MSTTSATPAFASVGEAIDMARAALGYLAEPELIHRDNLVVL